MVNQVIVKEDELLESRELREKYLGKIEVLDKVGDLLLPPNTEYATAEKINIYYQVGKEAIQIIMKRNYDELQFDGAREFKKNEVINFLNVQNEQLKNLKGKTEILLDNENIIVPNRGMKLFSKRAILRIGMLNDEPL